MTIFIAIVTILILLLSILSASILLLILAGMTVIFKVMEDLGLLKPSQARLLTGLVYDD